MPDRARLITIPISHFCEKARWALDRAGVPFNEEKHLQFVHIAAAKRAGGGRTVPVLVTTDGRVYPESADILRYADTRVEPERRLYPDGEVGAQAAALEADFDAGLGPDGRRWMYFETLPVVREMEAWALDGVPTWERRMFRSGGPLVGWSLKRYLNIDADTAEASRVRVSLVFDDVAERLSDGRRFLVGDRFTAADLAFAALAAPMLVPEQYGSPLPPLEVMPERLAAEARRLRAHPAGVFADRLYVEERARPDSDA